MNPETAKFPFRVFLGNDKGNGERVYLQGFQWDCDWYWAGGYLEYMSPSGTSWRAHTHFNHIFLDSKYSARRDYPEYAVWLDLSDILDNAQYDSKQWWRIKDLYKQFYTLKEAAAVFQYGGHCTSDKRNPSELNPQSAELINRHIEKVIIPEILKVLGIS